MDDVLVISQVARDLLLRAQRPTQVDPYATVNFNAKAYATATQSVAPATDFATLTQRERKALDLIARGFSYHEIATILGVTVHTVQTHIKRVYSKLAVHSRGEAVFEASKLGLLQPGLFTAD